MRNNAVIASRAVNIIATQNCCARNSFARDPVANNYFCCHFRSAIRSGWRKLGVFGNCVRRVSIHGTRGNKNKVWNFMRFHHAENLECRQYIAFHTILPVATWFASKMHYRVNARQFRRYIHAVGKNICVFLSYTLRTKARTNKPVCTSNKNFHIAFLRGMRRSAKPNIAISGLSAWRKFIFLPSAYQRGL